MSGTLWLLAAALVAGGLREPRLFAAGGALAWILVWRARPWLGAVAAWLPWLGWAALSGAFSPQPWAALPVLARWAAAVGFFSLALSWGEREREAWVKLIVVLVFVWAAAASWTGWERRFAPASMTGLLPPYYNYTGFALAAGACAALAWALHPSGPSGRWRWSALGAAGLAVACVLLAHSRGALLGLGAAGLFWIARRWGLKGAAAALVLAGAGLAAAAFVPAGREFLLKAHRARGEARPAIWASAAETAIESPWLGAGPGDFKTAFRRRPVPSPGAARWGLGTPYAHSEPLQAAAETGWAGLLLWLLGAGVALSALWGRARPDAAREAAAAAAAAMTAQLLVDNMLQVPGLAWLWLSALAVARGPASSADAGAGGRRWTGWACALGCALALSSWVPEALARRGPALAAALFPADADPVEDLAYRAEAAGDAGGAYRLWARAEALSPFNAVYPFRLAQLDAAAGRWAAAARAAGRAADLEPGFRRARLLRAESLWRAGRAAQAAAELAALKALLAAPPAGSADSGYEREIAGFDAGDRDALARLENAMTAQRHG